MAATRVSEEQKAVMRHHKRTANNLPLFVECRDCLKSQWLVGSFVHT